MSKALERVGVMKSIPRLLFINFEASSIGVGSFPIEVGWCHLNGRGTSHLIRPDQSWTAWSLASQRIHGISREELQTKAAPVEQVAHSVAAALAPERAVVLSDAPLFDQFWLNKLLVQGGVPVTIPIVDLWELLGGKTATILRQAGVPDRAVSHLIRETGAAARREVEARGPPRHRALPDAQRNAATWRTVVRQAEKIAVRWRRALRAQFFIFQARGRTPHVLGPVKNQGPRPEFEVVQTSAGIIDFDRRPVHKEGAHTAAHAQRCGRSGADNWRFWMRCRGLRSPWRHPPTSFGKWNWVYVGFRNRIKADGRLRPSGGPQSKFSSMRSGSSNASPFAAIRAGAKIGHPG
jgi:DNA polymerase III epsilon subunit-like protein